MTTNVVVKPANYPVRVTVTDEYRSGENYHYSETVEYVKAGEERVFYTTTTRTVSVIDVEYDLVEGSREAARIKE